MPRRHDEHEFVEEPGGDALLAEPERMSSDDAEVHGVPANLLLDEGGVAEPQAEYDSWVFALESRNDAWEHVDPRRRAGANDQRAALEPAEIGDGLAGARQGSKQPQGVLLENPAGFREGNLPSQTVEQTRPQLTLHLGHVLGEGGLAQVHGLRRRAETTGFGHGQEYLELPEAGLHKLYLMGLIRTSNWRLCKDTRRLGPVDILRLEPGVRLMAFVAVFAFLAAGEALIPRRVRAVGRRGRWPTNIALIVLNTLVVRLALPMTAVGMAVLAEQHGWGLFHAVGAMPSVLSIAIAVLLLDLAIYLQHVVFHAVPILWRVHRMHHADIDVDVTTGTRFHPVEIVLSIGVKLVTISALGASPLAVLLFEVLLNVGSMFNHANLRLPPGCDRVLRLLVVTPDMHRVHHSARGVEINTNFGFTFPWWDHLCGTYRAQPVAGHVAMTVGLTDFRDPKYLRLGITLLQPLLDGSGSQASGNDRTQSRPPMRPLTQRDRP